MSAVQTIAKNTTLLFLSQIISYMLGFFITIYTATYLGTAGFGTLSAALALGGMLMIFTELGLPTLMIREISREKSLTSTYISNVLLLKSALSIITLLIAFVIVNIIGYPPNVAAVIYIIVGSFIVNAFATIFTAVFQANEKMKYLSIGSILNSIIMLSGVLIAVFYHMPIIVFALIYLITNLILLAFQFFICIWKFVFPKKIEFDPGLSKFLLLEALPLTISGIFLLIAFRIDTVLLSAISGNVAAGIYSAAYKLMEALLFIPTVYVIAIFPLLSKLYVDSKEKLKFSYEKSFKYLILLGLPIAVGTTLLANPIILTIYKPEFYQSIIALQILIWAIPLLFLNNILAVSINAINKQRETVRSSFLAMLLNVVLNLIFIPKYGFVAASIITVLTELSFFIFWFHIMNNHGYKISLTKILLKPALASLIMGLFIVLVKLNFILVIILATIIYFGVLILLKTFSDDDINLFKQIMDIDLLNKILKRSKK